MWKSPLFAFIVLCFTVLVAVSVLAQDQDAIPRKMMAEGKVVASTPCTWRNADHICVLINQGGVPFVAVGSMHEGSFYILYIVNSDGKEIWSYDGKSV